ncbi:MAG: UV-endonuclease UvdE [Clostridia bacterium]|jgi:UV DNA damage endonuclease|nr:UV-endonuclease UvdE [Clostridia bacterium]
MAIGYACIALGVNGTSMRSCVAKNADDARLQEITRQNLEALERIIDYNIENNISLYRISSDIIPFGSHPLNTQRWWEDNKEKFNRIHHKIIKSGMRVSMHPGQYTIINSPREEVVAKSVKDLIYHDRFLAALGVDSSHKMILHIGGIYEDKGEAINRFVENYEKLPESVKTRLVIENDERCYSIQDVCHISKLTGAPVVFDNLHHEINPPADKKTVQEWIKLASLTWKASDGPAKIHYSQQSVGGKPGAHSKSIHIGAFLEFYKEIEEMGIDVMIEVKDKNLSAIKCNYTVHADEVPKVSLEKEWARYKYLVLSQSANDYFEMRKLMKIDVHDAVMAFYGLAEHAQMLPFDRGAQENAALHVWGYFKDKCTVSEKKGFLKKLDDFMQGNIEVQILKNYLWKMAEKYNEKYLLDSYYFIKV